MEPGLLLYLDERLPSCPCRIPLIPPRARAVPLPPCCAGPPTAVAGLARRFAAEGHELALVGGSVRDVFLGPRHGDVDLATDARPGEVRTIAAGWADTIWETGIEFGTVGLSQRQPGLRDHAVPARAVPAGIPQAGAGGVRAGGRRRTWPAGTSRSTPSRRGCPRWRSSTRSAASVT